MGTMRTHSEINIMFEVSQDSSGKNTYTYPFTNEILSLNILLESRLGNGDALDDCNTRILLQCPVYLSKVRLPLVSVVALT